MEDLKTTKLKKAQLAARLMGGVLTEAETAFWKDKPGVVPVVIKTVANIGTKKN